MSDQPNPVSDQPQSAGENTTPASDQPASASSKPVAAPDQAKPAAKQPAVATDTITFDDFMKIKLRVGKVIEAYDHPNADKLLVIKVDLGDEQRQICAGLKGHYAPEDLVGKNLILVANLAPRMMRGVESQGMLLAASSTDHSQIIFATTDSDIAPGSAVS